MTSYLKRKKFCSKITVSTNHMKVVFPKHEIDQRVDVELSLISIANNVTSICCIYIRVVSYSNRIAQDEGGCAREGVQSSSNSNHRHPNLFCGKRAPQLVISTTSNSNHPKKA